MGIILPPSTIGLLGGGQLGRMFCFEAKRMGYKVIVLDPDIDCPAGQVCDEQIVAQYDDLNAAIDLANRSDVLTYEFENVDVNIVKELEKIKSVYPGSNVLEISQHRFEEKSFLNRCGVKTADFALIQNEDDLKKAFDEILVPVVLKTCRFGYDGKGQKIIRNFQDTEDFFEKFKSQDLIWEKMVNFEKECSVIASRNVNGEIVVYPVCENIHKDNVLDLTIIPARISEDSAKKATEYTKLVAEKLNIVGTFCIEYFIMLDGEVLANEIAPRPHNSGHYSIEAGVTSQFENQVRAVCNLPLGSTDLIMPTVMLNILGDEYSKVLEKMDEILKMDKVYLHLYGKSEARSKRKMGHVTVMGESVDQCLEKIHIIKGMIR